MFCSIHTTIVYRACRMYWKILNVFWVKKKLPFRVLFEAVLDQIFCLNQTPTSLSSPRIVNGYSHNNCDRVRTVRFIVGESGLNKSQYLEVKASQNGDLVVRHRDLRDCSLMTWTVVMISLTGFPGPWIFKGSQDIAWILVAFALHHIQFHPDRLKYWYLSLQKIGRNSARTYLRTL